MLQDVLSKGPAPLISDRQVVIFDFTGSAIRYFLWSFIPILLYCDSIKDEYIFICEEYLQIILGITLLSSLNSFYAGAKLYDALLFLGIRQINYFSNHKFLTDSGSLNTRGILNEIHHP